MHLHECSFALTIRLARRGGLTLGLVLALAAPGCGKSPNERTEDTNAQSGDGDGDGDMSGDGDGDGSQGRDDAGHPADEVDGGGCPMVTEQDATGELTGSAAGLLPRPRVLELLEGQFALTPRSAISVHGEAARAPAMLLRELLARGTGYALPVIQAEQEACAGDSLVVLEHEAGVEPGSYRLRVTSERVTLSAGGSEGLVYGLQTLRQLFAPEIQGVATGLKARWLIPALRIDDAPRFRYRGLHLDVSRHFFSVAFIKRYIDLLAAYKLNVFHFHLTDDQGFRVEIKKYPLLTERGAFRQENGQSYGGFYTQDDIREIVAHASARGVMVIPEIEMPGHATAALAAYPALGCAAGPFVVPSTWGVFENLFCPTEETFGFLEDVLSEVFALFPSPYVHIGGDEVPKAQWQASAEAQAVMAREGLADEEALQAYFVRRIETFARAQGRTIIGWDEIMADGVPTTATIMAWRNVEVGKTAAEQGYDVIMTPNAELYFDHYQADPATEPKAFGGHTTVANVLSFNPLPAGISAAGAAHILGAQANVWTEYMESEKHVEYMVFPRAIALAEVLWSSDATRGYVDFVSRLIAHAPHLDAAGVNYARHALTVVPQAPYKGVHPIPGTLEMEDYDVGGEGVAYHDGSAGNTPAKYRSDDVDIEETPGGGYDVGYVEAGEWLEYSVLVTNTGPYRVELRTAAPQEGVTLHLELDGLDVSGPIVLPATADWNVFATHSVEGVTLSSGPHVLRVNFDKLGGNIDWLRFTAM